jgi:hypothetical protein
MGLTEPQTTENQAEPNPQERIKTALRKHFQDLIDCFEYFISAYLNDAGTKYLSEIQPIPPDI